MLYYLRNLISLDQAESYARGGRALRRRTHTLHPRLTRSSAQEQLLKYAVGLRKRNVVVRVFYYSSKVLRDAIFLTPMVSHERLA